MKRVFEFLYGVIAYAIFLGVFLYAVGFLGNFGVPKSIDSGAEGSLGAALLIDVALLTLFAVQHSVMARPTFKRWWTQYIPKTVERSTYVMASNAVMVALFVWWRPITATVWDIQSTAGRTLFWAIFAGGFGLVLVTTFLINHFDLFGLRQVWLRLRGVAYTPVGFVQPALYRMIRHPLYVGWMTAFWATPRMTLGHFVFAAGTTLYMLIAIQFEERNLAQEHGERYLAYRRRTPMLVPRLGRRSTGDGIVIDGAVAPQPVA